MEWNLKTIGIITTLFFLGYIIGLVEAAIKQHLKDQKKGSQTEKAGEQIEPSPVKAPDLLSLNLDSSGNLVTAIKGNLISSKEDLSPENRQVLINLLVKLRPWLETGELEKPQVQPAQVVPSVPSVEKKALKPQKPVPPKKGDKPLPPESMVAQIDAILQAQLTGSSLENRGIRLLETPSGGVQVFVGLQPYDGIQAVPDEEIKTAIKRAVSDWEKRN